MVVWLRCRGVWTRPQQPPNFGRQYPFVPRHFAQRVADATLRLAVTVEGCAVDIAYALCPRRAHDRFCLIPCHPHPMTAEGRTAEPENSYLNRGAPEWALLETRHISDLPVSIDPPLYSANI